MISVRVIVMLVIWILIGYDATIWIACLLAGLILDVVFNRVGPNDNLDTTI